MKSIYLGQQQHRLQNIQQFLKITCKLFPIQLKIISFHHQKTAHSEINGMQNLQRCSISLFSSVSYCIQPKWNKLKGDDSTHPLLGNPKACSFIAISASVTFLQKITSPSLQGKTPKKQLNASDSSCLSFLRKNPSQILIDVQSLKPVCWLGKPLFIPDPEPDVNPDLTVTGHYTQNRHRSQDRQHLSEAINQLCRRDVHHQAIQSGVAWGNHPRKQEST